MLRNVGLRKSVEQPVLDLNFAASQIGSNAAPDSRIDFSRGSNAWFVDSDGLVKKSPHNLAAQSEDLGNGWALFNASASLNTAISPTGELTADKVVTDNSATLSTATKQVTGLDDSVDVAVSVYVKAAGQTVVNVQFYNKANTFHGSGDYDLTTGTRTSNPSAGTQSSIENVGNDWYRITFTGLNMGTGGTTPSFRVVCNQTGDGSKGFLVWGAQLSQHTTLPVGNPYIKTDSSAVYAARLDHDPSWFMSAAQEQNLEVQSEDLQVATDLLGRSTVTGNDTTAPDGTTTADKLVVDGTAGQSHYMRFLYTVDPSTEVTFSIHAKADELSEFDITTYGSLGFESSAVTTVDLSAGTVTKASGHTTATSEALDDGWFRVSLTENTGSTDTDRLVQIHLRSGGSQTFDGDSTSGMHFWGIQFEVGSTASTYHRTEGAPYYGEGATPKGLLIEEARTNLVTDSEEFDDSMFTAVRLSVTANQSLAPDGTSTADEIVEDSSASDTHILRLSSSVTTGNDYTFSVFAKRASGTRNILVSFRSTNGAFTLSSASFDLGAGTVTNNSVNSASIEDYGNGWFRCSITETAAATATARLQFNILDGVSGTYTGDGTSGLFLWGAQLEQGSFPTSYIKTTGSTATRNADVATMGPTVAPLKTTGPEFVTNGTFPTNVDGWTGNSSNLSYQDGVLRITADSAGVGANIAQQLVSGLVIGKRYRATMRAVAISQSGRTVRFRIRDTSDSTTISEDTTTTAGTTLTADFTATATSHHIRVRWDGNSSTTTSDFIEADDISVKEILPGTELVTNGTYDTDTSGWSNSRATLSVVSGKLRVTSTGGNYPMAFQEITTVIGRRYRITADVTFGTTAGAVIQVNSETGQSFTTSGGVLTSSGSVSADFTANITNTNIILHGNTGTSAGEYQEFDNVSVRELYPFEQYNPAEGTVVCESERIGNLSFDYIWELGTDSAGENMALLTLDANNIYFGHQADSSGGLTFNAIGAVIGETNITAYAYQQDNYHISSATEGALEDSFTDTSINVADADRLGIGCRPRDEAGHGNCLIKRLTYYPYRLNDDICDSKVTS